MPRVELRCRCGYVFFLPQDKVEGNDEVKCPFCAQPVGVEGPASVPFRPVPTQKTRVLQAGEPEGYEAGMGRMKKLMLWLGLAAGGLVLLVVILLMYGGSGPRDPVDLSSRPTYGGSSLPSDRPTPRVPAPREADPAPAAPTPAPARPGFVPPPVPAAPVPADPPGALPPPAAAGEPLPLDLASQLREGVVPLPAFYRDLLLGPDERARVDRAASSGRASVEEINQLKALLASDKFRVVREEVALIAETAAKLEKEALEGLPVDRITTTDNRVLAGRILEETAETVKLERKLVGGGTGLMNLKRSEIKELGKGRGIGKEFGARWQAAQKAPVAERSALLSWCKENSLSLQARFIAFHILREDPGHGPSRAEAGLPPNPVQVALEAAAQGGMISYQGRSWTPRDLKERLIKEGFVLLNGEWHSRKERMITVPGLFRYERQDDKPVSITSSTAPINHDAETTFKMVQDLNTNSFVEQAEVKLNRRFHAPTLSAKIQTGMPAGASAARATPGYSVQTQQDVADPPAGKPVMGEVLISVPVGQPIVEASVTTLAEIKSGGSIAVFMIAEGGNRIKLYDCAAKEDGSHKLPDAIRGRSTVDLVAVMTATAAYTSKLERRIARPLKKDTRGAILQPGLEIIHYRQIPEFKAVLFPSNSNTIEVFRLKVAVAEPAQALNRLFSAPQAQEILRQ